MGIFGRKNIIIMKTIPKWLTVLVVISFIALLGGGLMFYSVTQKPNSPFTQKVIRPIVGFVSGFTKHQEVENSKPAFEMTADELQAAYLNNRENAMKSYDGKVLQVSGKISNIASPTDTNIVILLTIENDPLSNISCQMDPAYNERLKQIAPGETITMKGICNGFKEDDLLGSLDVLLNRCVVVQ